VFTYVTEPGVPPVSVLRLDRSALDRVDSRAHAHDFPGLVYFERSGGLLRHRDHEWPVEPGDVYLIAPGAVVDIGRPDDLLRARGWGVFFTSDVLAAVGQGAGTTASPLDWRIHPLLNPFLPGTTRAVLRLNVPPPERAGWVAEIAAIEREMSRREAGYRHAAMAHLVVLLVGVSRLTADTAGDLRRYGEGLLADVFAVIEQRFREPLSLSDVADAVHLSPGHLTTTVRRKTGRTVQDWIVERRMNEARRLLVDTDLAVAEIGRRVGYPDAAYFGRVFSRAHDVTPSAWRAAR